MRPSVVDMNQIRLERIETDDPHAVGRQRETVTGGKKVRLSHGTRFKKNDSEARLVVRCDLTDPKTGA